MNDKQCRMIEAARQGNERAFEQLYQEFYKLAFYFAYKLCRNEADAKDAVQDAFIEIHRSISSLKEVSYFKAWLYKIVHSKCKKIFRKNKYTITDFEDDPIIGNMKEKRMEFTPEMLTRFHSDQEVLHACIDQLPLSQREIILLFYMEQMSIKEIADVLDVPVGTVKSRLSYGRNYLKDMLEEYQSVHDMPISFHALDGLVATILFAQMNQMQVVIPALSNGVGLFTLRQSGTWKVLAVSVCLSAVCGGYLLVHDRYTDQMAQENRIFQTVQMQNEAISTAQDAYFTLISWACCEEMIMEKNPEELSQMEPLYSELKRYGGEYYRRLEKEQWTTAFERCLNQ